MRSGGWQQGFGDGLAQAMGLVFTPLVFGFAGVLLDGLLGTRPLLMLLLGAFGVVGTFASAYYEYKAKMERAEVDKPWTRRSA